MEIKWPYVTEDTEEIKYKVVDTNNCVISLIPYVIDKISKRWEEETLTKNLFDIPTMFGCVIVYMVDDYILGCVEFRPTRKGAEVCFIGYPTENFKSQHAETLEKIYQVAEERFKVSKGLNINNNNPY